MPYTVAISGSVYKTSSGYNPAVLDSRELLTWPYTSPGKLNALPSVSIGRSNSTVTIAAAISPGAVANTFGADWYERIHITPSKVDVGNLMSLQVRDVIVWNAYFSSKTLNSISETADSGINLVEPSPAPVVFTPLMLMTYQLSVGPNGPPVVSGLYLFDFGFIQLPLSASGNRIVVWSIVPQHQAVEILEWKTDVMRAKAGEQRIALRNAPRQSFQYNYFMDDRQTLMAEIIAKGWAHRQFGVPVWFEAAFIGSTTSGQTTIAVDTTSADYRVGETILAWQDYENYEAANVQSMTSGVITLTIPLALNLSGVYVLPMRYARASSFTISRGPNKLTKLSADFNCTVNKDHSASIGLPTHDGLEVLIDPMMLVGSYEERVEKITNVIDNGLGTVSLDGKYDNTDHILMVSWVFNNRVDLWRIKRWLHSLKGKQKTFWLPGNSTDFELVADVAINDNSINVKSVLYSLYMSTCSIVIEKINGSKTFHSVTGGTTNGGVDTLSFASPVATQILISDVKCISIMHKVRLDSDRVEINHEENNLSTLSVPVAEVSK